jgi:uncharacterized protein YbjT (DUF2867 family)
MKVIVTGASGMVGEGVMLECLSNPAVTEVLVIGRKHCGTTHPKLKEILHPDFFDLSHIENQLAGYDACFFCLGVSSVGMKEEEFTKYTYTLTTHFAEKLAKYSPQAVLCYISGAGTRSDEKGAMWARVKGKTENDLMKLPLRGVYAFRPGFMKITVGQKNALAAYKYFSWMYPIVRPLGMATTIQEVGKAMIAAATKGYPTKVIEIKDILVLAKG